MAQPQKPAQHILSTHQTLYLPDTLANWPWKRSINPYYEEVSAASAAWLRSFGAFSPTAQRAFDKCNFGLLASLAYPRLSKEHLRIGCDLMNLYFVIDEHTDIVNTAAEAEVMVAVVLDALHHPDKPRAASEWVGGEVARQFWHNAINTMCPLAQEQFLEHFSAYLSAVVVEAADRGAETVHTVESYLALRASTIGLLPSLDVVMAGLDELTAEDMRQPTLITLTSLSTTLIGLGNDIVSYSKERAELAAGHNIVSVVLQTRRHSVNGQASPEPGTLADEQAALHWVAAYHEELAQAFVAKYAAFCGGLSDTQEQLRAYADGLGNWVRANDQWSYESQRYFGTQGLVVQHTRAVQLRPVQRKVAPLAVALDTCKQGQVSGSRAQEPLSLQRNGRNGERLASKWMLLAGSVALYLIVVVTQRRFASG